MEKLKKIFALIGVVFLLGMYLSSFICAIFATKAAHSMFLASLAATIAVPVLLYAYTLIYRITRGGDNAGEGTDGDDATLSKKAFDEAMNRKEKTVAEKHEHADL